MTEITILQDSDGALYEKRAETLINIKRTPTRRDLGSVAATYLPHLEKGGSLVLISMVKETAARVVGLPSLGDPTVTLLDFDTVEI
jgi:hypothetical protein